MGEVVTGNVETESMMQRSPGIGKGFAMRRRGMGKEGNWARAYHTYRCSAGQGSIKKRAMK